MENKFYGDGDLHENKGHTDSQLCARRSRRFTTMCIIVEVERSLINFEQHAQPTKACTVPCLVRLVVGL